MASAEGVAGPAPHARVGTACASEGRPGEPGRAPGPPPPAVPGGVSVALLAPRSEQGRAGSRWGRLGSCCPCRVGSRGLLHPLSSRTSLGREGRGRTGCHGARRVGGPAPGGSGAPRAPRGGPPRPGTRPQSRQQSRAGGKFPLALCPGTLGAAVPTWAGGSRGQGPGSHSTGSQRGLANRPPTQTREPLCSGGRQRGAGGTEARGGSEAAAPSRADGASSPRAEPRVPGTLRGAGGCRSSRSPHKGASSSAVGRGWPRVCSRGLLATLGGACQGLALSEEGLRRGGSSVCTGIVPWPRGTGSLVCEGGQGPSLLLCQTLRRAVSPQQQSPAMSRRPFAESGAGFQNVYPQTFLCCCSVQGTLSEPRRRLVASSSHSQPRRAEVSGSEVKVNPGIAGKATRRARPTDPESAGCTRLRLSREHRLSGLAGVGPRDRAGQGLTH